MRWRWLIQHIQGKTSGKTAGMKPCLYVWSLRLICFWLSMVSCSLGPEEARATWGGWGWPKLQSVVEWVEHGVPRLLSVDHQEHAEHFLPKGQHVSIDTDTTNKWMFHDVWLILVHMCDASWCFVFLAPLLQWPSPGRVAGCFEREWRWSRPCRRNHLRLVVSYHFLGIWTEIFLGFKMHYWYMNRSFWVTSCNIYFSGFQI